MQHTALAKYKLGGGGGGGGGGEGICKEHVIVLPSLAYHNRTVIISYILPRIPNGTLMDIEFLCARTRVSH